jgi:hypothetical protein
VPHGCSGCHERYAFMVCDYRVDRLIRDLPTLERNQCVEYVRSFHKPDLDFTDRYLKKLSLKDLRRILYAACVQVKRSKKR